jgi:ligand of Numb protein X 1/2
MKIVQSILKTISAGAFRNPSSHDSLSHILPPLFQNPSESLGISVAGGVGSQRGDVPIYITNIQPQGVLGRSRQVKVSI